MYSITNKFHCWPLYGPSRTLLATKQGFVQVPRYSPNRLARRHIQTLAVQGAPGIRSITTA